MSNPSNKQTVNKKLEHLEQIVAWFESEEITIEESIKKYEQALKLARDIEVQLAESKNQVEVIKKKFS